ncbi:uncharacterized protein MONBRDRAFT_26125 [Monosiga brevicollis MX1]|uniref:Malectin domain-containing protein n=1 Tax=Monosiga brevicollis TaxID=81824 RepID=A9V1F5_MONBE|nr:uncharacterized protein MONBRDRAFT_26125 [Monosiga brevicollis MX1]EDQ88431.1 predicted protein [Monosiga brevicollis MX1]|eukprot:XP_001746535.1 hypothetical protein [Monosiga brevicollis MX1]
MCGIAKLLLVAVGVLASAAAGSGATWSLSLSHLNTSQEAPGNNGCSHGGSDPNCGFNTNHNVSLYTSPDLSNGSWTYAGDMLPVDARPEAIYYRPKIVFNPTTSRYVLWINAVPAGNFSASYYVVATSTVRTGPFVVQATHVALAQDAPGDFDIFVDDDDQGYIIYTAITAVRQSACLCLFNGK